MIGHTFECRKKKKGEDKNFGISSNVLNGQQYQHQNGDRKDIGQQQPIQFGHKKGMDGKVGKKVNQLKEKGNGQQHKWQQKGVGQQQDHVNICGQQSEIRQQEQHGQQIVQNVQRQGLTHDVFEKQGQ
jgi:hypothetical protein